MLKAQQCRHGKYTGFSSPDVEEGPLETLMNEWKQGAWGLQIPAKAKVGSPQGVGYPCTPVPLNSCKTGCLSLRNNASSTPPLIVPLWALGQEDCNQCYLEQAIPAARLVKLVLIFRFLCSHACRQEGATGPGENMR